MTLPQPQLDHIIIHVPASTLRDPPASIVSAFTTAPGGRHGDGITENRLIVFADGTYLELLAFTTPTPPSDHFWANKGYGIIDYAFTLANGAADYPRLQAKWAKLDLPQGWKPGPLQKGSRLRPDGEKIEWEVAFPARNVRGCAPFWCFDVTPREVRVPSDAELIEHPCGAKGVGDLMVFVDDERRTNLKRLLDALMPPTQAVEGKVDEYSWDLATPRKIAAGVPCSLSLMLPPKAGYAAQAVWQRNLVARMTVLTNGKDEGTGQRNVKEAIEGDELSIGFVTC